MSREQLDSGGEQRAPDSAGDAAGGGLAPGKQTITEMVPSTYSGPPSSGRLGPGKRTLVESQQARTLPKVKEFVDTFHVHANLDGRQHDVVVEVSAP